MFNINKILKNRRINLLKNLDENAVVIIATNPEQQRNSDVNYPFRADSNFYYFTGFCEQNSLMVLSKKEFIIFLQPNDEHAEMWNGRRVGLKNGKIQLNAKTKDINKIKNTLGKILKKYARVYFDFANIDTNLLDILTVNKYASLKENIAKLRVIKDEFEINLIQQACKISDKAHIKAMRQIKNMEFEYQVQSIFDGFFTFNNASHAYPPIVAAGENSLILHYQENNQRLDKNDLILIDSGCEYQNYASDITRTFPINGKFSNSQKEIYTIVLKAQIEAIKFAKMGESIKKPHKIATEIIKLGLEKLGILPQNSTKEQLQEFFPHGTSHFMGLDVHDIGEYKVKNEDITLEKGMVITIEPAIYIAKNVKIADKYWNIGIRIEDDILITNDKPIVLTKAPKSINEIENTMQQ